MSAQLVRIVLLQVVTIIFTVVIVGFMLKVRFGSGSHYPILATYTRDYGVLLLLLPVIWGVWGLRENNNQKPDLGDTGTVLFTGVMLWVALLVFGYVSLATIPGSTIQVVREQPAKPARETSAPDVDGLQLDAADAA